MNWLSIQGVLKKMAHFSFVNLKPPWPLSKKIRRVWPLPVHAVCETVFDRRVRFA